ncbi:MAG TPA: hypothetical protein VK864_09860 [Longimicrobiales bacterium]|nr:hypothetical protein [Longimicrobiales bacterium]
MNARIPAAPALVRISSIILWAAALAGLAVAVLATGRFLTTRATLFLVAAVGAALLAVILARAARAAAVHRVQLSIALVSTVVAVYACEAALWWYSPRTAVGDRLRAMAGLDDRSILSVLQTLRLQGTMALPPVVPQTFFDRPRTLQPLAGAANRYTVQCNEAGRWLFYQSDAHGFNNPPAAWSQPTDILILGDSYMHGMCVPNDESVAARLRARWPGTLNLGQAGNGPLTMYAALREYGVARRPNVVLWAFYEGNDLEDLERERRQSILMQYLDPTFTQRLAERQPEIDSAVEALFASELTRTLQRETQARPLPPARDLADLWQLRALLGLIHVPRNYAAFADILKRAQSAVQSWNGHLYLVYLPVWTPALERRGAANRKRDQLLAAIQPLGIPVIDLYPLFQERGPRKLMVGTRRYQGHYNAEGYRVVATAISDSIQRLLHPATTRR